MLEEILKNSALPPPPLSLSIVNGACIFARTTSFLFPRTVFNDY